MRTLMLVLTVAFLSSAVSVAVGDRAERDEGRASVTVPDSAVRNIARTLRQQDTQTDRIERRLRSLRRDMDDVIFKLDTLGPAVASIAWTQSEVSGRVHGIDNNVQDQFGSGLRYHGRNLAGLIMCIYDSELLGMKSCGQ